MGEENMHGESREKSSAPPASKKAATKPPSSSSKSNATKQQASLMSFFSSTKKVSSGGGEIKKDSVSNSASVAASTSVSLKKDDHDASPHSSDAIVPVSSKIFTATWESLADQHVLIRRPNLHRGIFVSRKDEVPYTKRSKVAALDMDGTLLKWISESPGFWPSRLEHYELWNSRVVEKLRNRYDQQNFRLVVFTNQGGIQKAHSGKRADLLRQLTEWLEQSIIKRPITVIASTRSPKKSTDSFHKPSGKMWTDILMGSLKEGVEINIQESFFVGDSAEETDSQGGVDRKFANAIGLKFYTPDEFFGPSSQELRAGQRTAKASGDITPTPKAALRARAALLGGYLKTPIMIILCGVQGSGKSTFCQQVLGLSSDVMYVPPPCDEENDSAPKQWTWLSQDTINNGKPGKREKVERLAREALLSGNSVIVDRMHLDPEQRHYFVDIAKRCKVQAHVVLLNPPPAVVKVRVQNRTNHPGKVQGDFGAKLTMGSLAKLVVPTYKEDVDLISVISNEISADQMAVRYRNLMLKGDSNAASLVQQQVLLQEPSSPSQFTFMPTIILGTMGIGKRKCKEVVTAMLKAGFDGVDTAPTYKNEDKIGEVMQDPNVSDDPDFVYTIVKVPKRAATADEVKAEIKTTLSTLLKDTIDLILLHWPCDVILQNTLPQVWNTMEEYVKEEKCRALGVCNFNQAALGLLLQTCTIRPVVNQVERHPLLAQMDLVDFCARNGIVMQAHTPLAQGSEALLGNTVVQTVAKETSLSPAQVVIAWNVQQGVAVVPKCTQEAHAKEMMQVLSAATKSTVLSPEQMKALDG
ncbi:MAG: hypothetical protein SGILL_008574, partial [Bacillariaceae sp.]